MIRIEQHERVTLLRIDRHEARNALNVEVVAGLMAGLDEAVKRGDRVIVITGEGSSFCAGADLDIVREDAFREGMYELIHRVADIAIPVVAAVNGPAIGAGTQLAIACDLRVAGPSARFAVPTARLGLAVDTWTVRRVAALAGGGAARAMLLGVDTIGVERAHQLGLVDRLGDLDSALAWATELAGLAPLTLEYNKLALNAVADLRADDPAVDASLAAVWESNDSREALEARAEGRRPEFLGR
jgi:enoyl-CoA hydratase